MALRIVRICTECDKRDLRLQELKELLLAKKIPRNFALLKITNKKSEKRPVFVLKYDPRLPPVQSIQAKHWRSMTAQDCHLKEVFSEPPMTAYRRQNNLRDILIKAKVPPAPNRYPQRQNKGMSRCGKDCTTCPYVKTGKTVTITWHLNKNLTCVTHNCVYLLECKKCDKRYIGETGRMLKARFSDHRGYINNQVIGVTTGDHFNLPGHSLANLQVTILEQVKKEDEQYRKERESYFINKFNTFYSGINKTR